MTKFFVLASILVLALFFFQIKNVPGPQIGLKPRTETIQSQPLNNGPQVSIEATPTSNEVVETPSSPPVSEVENLEAKPENSVSTNNKSTNESSLPEEVVIISPSPELEKEKLEEINLFFPDSKNFSPEEKAMEILSLSTIFKNHLVEMYKDIDISYIRDKPKQVQIDVLVEDAQEYLRDPQACEAKSDSIFIRTTKEFIDRVYKLKSESNSRFMKKMNK